MAKLLRTRVTDKDFTARFYYSLDGIDFHPIGNVLKMGLGLPWTAIWGKPMWNMIWNV